VETVRLLDVCESEYIITRMPKTHINVLGLGMEGKVRPKNHFLLRFFVAIHRLFIRRLGLNLPPVSHITIPHSGMVWLNQLQEFILSMSYLFNALSREPPPHPNK
jgi:hypothetical protein